MRKLSSNFCIKSITFEKQVAFIFLKKVAWKFAAGQYATIFPWEIVVDMGKHSSNNIKNNQQNVTREKVTSLSVVCICSASVVISESFMNFMNFISV